MKKIIFADVAEEQKDVNKIMMTIITIVVMICFCAVLLNYKTIKSLACISALLLAITILICGYLVYIRPLKKKFIRWVASVAVAIVFTIYTIKGYNEGVAVLWSFLVPGALMLLAGMIEGIAVSAYLEIFYSITFLTPIHRQLAYAYTDSFRIRFPVLFLACILFSVYINYRMKEVKIKQMRERARMEVSMEEERRKIGKITMQTIFSICNAVDAKDSYTKKHSERVAKYSKIIANELRWSKQEQENLYNMALLHDIGKIGVPDAILNKHEKLTEEEFQQMRKHPIIGGEILKDFTVINDVSTGAYYHHERYDGKGYPIGLKGEEIPIEARIIGIADSIDAMNSDRVYRGKKDISYILEQLEQGKGTQFDPNIDEIVISLIKEKKLRLDR